MKNINARLDSFTYPFYIVAPWFFRIALGIAFFLHGYKKLPAPFMMEEQHRMVTWFEDIFIPLPELFVSIVILMFGVFYIGHPDWFVWPPMKLLTSEQMFLFVLSIYFLIRGNK